MRPCIRELTVYSERTKHRSGKLRHGKKTVCSIRNQEMSSGLMIIILHVISKHALSFSETKNVHTKLLNLKKKKKKSSICSVPLWNQQHFFINIYVIISIVILHKLSKYNISNFKQWLCQIYMDCSINRFLLANMIVPQQKMRMIPCGSVSATH